MRLLKEHTLSRASIASYLDNMIKVDENGAKLERRAGIFKKSLDKGISMVILYIFDIYEIDR